MISAKTTVAAYFADVFLAVGAGHGRLEATDLQFIDRVAVVVEHRGGQIADRQLCVGSQFLGGVRPGAQPAQELEQPLPERAAAWMLDQQSDDVADDFHDLEGGAVGPEHGHPVAADLVQK